MIIEFLGNSLAQTKQTKQKFIKLYYLANNTFCWTFVLFIRLYHFDTTTFVVCFVWFVGISEFPKNSNELVILKPMEILCKIQLRVMCVMILLSKIPNTSIKYRYLNSFSTHFFKFNKKTSQNMVYVLTVFYSQN